MLAFPSSLQLQPLHIFIVRVSTFVPFLVIRGFHRIFKRLSSLTQEDLCRKAILDKQRATLLDFSSAGMEVFQEVSLVRVKHGRFAHSRFEE